MIDTVVVKFLNSLSDYQKSAYLHNTNKTPKGDIKEKFEQHFKIPNGTPIYIRHYPPNQTHNSPATTLQASLPRALFGDNTRMITSINQLMDACEVVNNFVRTIDLIPNFTIQEGILVRADFVYNHIVGNDLDNYLNILGSRHYPWRKTVVYPGEGVVFQTGRKRSRSSYYNKELETGRQLERGILRQETSLKSQYLVERAIRKQAPTLEHITIEMVKDILTRDLNRISLDKITCCDPSAYRHILIDRHGVIKGQNIYSHWQTLSECSYEELIKGRVTERTIQNWKKEIQIEGLPMLNSKLKYPLHPLRILL